MALVPEYASACCCQRCNQAANEPRFQSHMGRSALHCVCSSQTVTLAWRSTPNDLPKPFFHCKKHLRIALLVLGNCCNKLISAYTDAKAAYYNNMPLLLQVLLRAQALIQAAGLKRSCRTGALCVACSLRLASGHVVVKPCTRTLRTHLRT